ncbi:MAG: hypothetical protein K1X79_00700 [Oligoflexia bacterium]|nr:hypothetical protein [Oligoflexia bacterium]
MESLLKNFDLVPLDALMILVSAVLFVILWRTLAQVLFNPYIRLIEARERATVGATEGAQSDRQKAEAVTQQYEQQLLNARIAAMQGKLAVVDNAKAQAAQVIEKAEGQAQEDVRSVRWQIANQRESIKTKSLSQVQTLADLIIARVKNPITKVNSTTSTRQ